ncbi:MAG: hypothetical protein QOH76_2459 [Thermoleophilaceae bacterium]|jgi:hypothetical protein|nr:hypothetical protein [Thermoleophilaceae bacterium]
MSAVVEVANRCGPSYLVAMTRAMKSQTGSR